MKVFNLNYRIASDGSKILDSVNANLTSLDIKAISYALSHCKFVDPVLIDHSKGLSDYFNNL